jgi:thioredoxin-like negative regulator of GroEL
MTAPAAQLELADAAVAGFLAATKGRVLVEVSTSWCAPCRFQRPVLRKLAAEFAGAGTFVALDGDHAGTFNDTHAIDSFPQLLCFVDGQLAERHKGFGGAAETRTAVAGFLGVSLEGEPTPAEREFAAAVARADAKLEEIMDPPSRAVEPHLAELESAMDVATVPLRAELAAGRITNEELQERQIAEYRRLTAPFEDKLEALRKAQAEALDAYDAIMNEAAARFARELAPAPTSLWAAACKPGDPFCSIDGAKRDE